ncbi:hypothetical protein ACFVWR_06155 [Leifsonia sp. NPDC058292]|uniref:hypothetical protein n=1 Tax=Leifsonia sp. NPDC058292 TaxID=3346428 RepID=UPI0036DADBBC
MRATSSFSSRATSQEHRGSRISHHFVRGIGRVFREDILALTPARMTTGESDELVEDIVKFEGLLPLGRR